MLTLIILFIYFVSFTDKPQTGTPCLSERAVAQRTKWDIPTDELDYPVNAAYLDSLKRMGVTIHHCSRWFNGATVEMNAQKASQVEALSFVAEVEMTRDNNSSQYSKRKRVAPNHRTASYTSDQLAVYNLLPLHNAGYEGQGIVMTVCDGSFYNANTLSCFRQAQELGHYDFTDDTDGFYGSTGAHGTACLSAISGIKEDYHGAATGANYYLMRTEENNPESPKEMDNLVAALEKSDSLGVNIFSVSLGYAYFDNDEWTLPKSALDGQTTRVSRAATIAARKGMLVCVAAGNEANSSWHTITAPADADSILTVGAVDVNGNIGSFSSYGPSSDGRVKPEVCAVGVQAALINPGGNVVHSNGTSFATPLLAGMAACLWSALPNENAMQIRERIIRSAHLYPNYDAANQMGYGIPNAWEAYQMDIHTGVESVRNADTESRKILQNGQIYIIRNGETYTITGIKKR